jgi:hypothetical protein
LGFLLANLNNGHDWFDKPYLLHRCLDGYKYRLDLLFRWRLYEWQRSHCLDRHRSRLMLLNRFLDENRNVKSTSERKAPSAPGMAV